MGRGGGGGGHEVVVYLGDMWKVTNIIMYVCIGGDTNAVLYYGHSFEVRTNIYEETHIYASL